MKKSQAIDAFGALAQENRLDVLRMLVKAGPKGVAAMAIGAKLGMQPSKTSFHLAHLERAGLIESRKESRSVIYSASYDRIADLIRYLMEDCCAGDRRVVAACADIVAACKC